ncbi:MAG TPA: flagellar motor switch protein FliG [Thermodesulfobacteriota bacterium]|nr:flagellar motor switch protein FliG [Thermodesulfobacteriota bacterium]
MSLSGYEKAVIFLNIIGEETAAEIIKNLDMKVVGKLTTHMKQMKTVAKPKLEEVMKEVTHVISREDVIIGEGFIKKVLSKGLGHDNAEKILERASEASPLDSLKWVDPKALVNFFITEHPQTIALVLCLLEPAQAAEAMAALPEELRISVAMRIASIERISENTLEELEEVLKGHMELSKTRGMKIGGIKTLAEILNQCDRSIEETILSRIEEKNEAMANSIRQSMFVFDDLIGLDDRSIQMLLKEVNTEDLSLALKTTSEALREKMFKNMSQRAAQLLKEDMELKGPVRVSDVQKAQQGIVRIARRLEAEGKIILKRGGEEEIVV